MEKESELAELEAKRIKFDQESEKITLQKEKTSS
jgi:hypothetical protein